MVETACSEILVKCKRNSNWKAAYRKAKDNADTSKGNLFKFVGEVEVDSIDLFCRALGSLLDNLYDFSELDIYVKPDTSSNSKIKNTFEWIGESLIKVPKSIHGLLSAEKLYINCRKIEEVNFNGLEKLTDFSSAFANCHHLSSIDFSPLESLEVANSMFYNAGLTSVDLEPLGDTLKIANNMFAYCDMLRDVKVPKVFSVFKDGDGMFFETSIDNFPRTEFPALISSKSMFSQCSNLIRVDIPELPKVENAESMFANSALYNIKISLPELKSAESFLADCYSLNRVDIDLGQWFQFGARMFSGCYKLKEVRFARNVCPARSCAYMFKDCKSLIKIDAKFPFADDIMGVVQNCESLRDFSFTKSMKNATLAVAAFCGVTADEIDCSKMEKLSDIRSIFAESNIKTIHLPKLDNVEKKNRTFCWLDMAGDLTLTFPTDAAKDFVFNNFFDEVKCKVTLKSRQLNIPFAVLPHFLKELGHNDLQNVAVIYVTDYAHYTLDELNQVLLDGKIFVDLSGMVLDTTQQKIDESFKDNKYVVCPPISEINYMSRSLSLELNEKLFK